MDGPLRHTGTSQVHQPVHAVAALRRNGHDLGKLMHLPVGINQRQQARLAHQVHLVDDEERSEEHTSELQSPCNLVCRLLLEKKKNIETSKLVLHKYDHTRPDNDTLQ